MKRFALTTALTATLATGALAQTASEEAAITRVLPDVNFEMLSETEIQTLAAIAVSGEEDTEVRSRMQAIVADANNPAVTLSEADRARVAQAAPDLNVDMLTPGQQAQVLSVLTSANSDVELRNDLQALDFGPDNPGMLSSADIATIESVDPMFDTTMLTDGEIASLRAAIATGDRDEIQEAINEIQAG